MNCSVPDDYFCGQITCSALFSHVDIDLTMEITRVDDSDWPRRYISAYISLSVRDKLTWSHSFLDGEKFKVPGFPLKVEGFEGADVFLQVSLNKENRTIYFKVSMTGALNDCFLYNICSEKQILPRIFYCLNTAKNF